MPRTILNVSILWNEVLLLDTTRCSNALVMKLYFVNTNEKRAINIPGKKLPRNWIEQFKCKFFLKWQVLKTSNCLSWCYMNLSSDVNLTRESTFFISLLLFPMEWQNREQAKGEHLTWLPPPYIFLTTACYKVV